MKNLFVEEAEKKVNEFLTKNNKWNINLPNWRNCDPHLIRNTTNSNNLQLNVNFPYLRNFNPHLMNDKVNITINDIAHCKLNQFNDHELDFIRFRDKFIFKYKDRTLTNVKHILDFTRKHGNEEESLEIEKFIFEYI